MRSRDRKNVQSAERAVEESLESIRTAIAGTNNPFLSQMLLDLVPTLAVVKDRLGLMGSLL